MKTKRVDTVERALDRLLIVHAALVIDGDDKKASGLQAAIRVLTKHHRYPRRPLARGTR